MLTGVLHISRDSGDQGFPVVGFLIVSNVYGTITPDLFAENVTYLTLSGLCDTSIWRP